MDTTNQTDVTDVVAKPAVGEHDDISLPTSAVTEAAAISPSLQMTEETKGLINQAYAQAVNKAQRGRNANGVSPLLQGLINKNCGSASTPLANGKTAHWDDVNALQDKLTEGVSVIATITPYLMNETLMKVVREQGNYERLMKRINGVTSDVQVIQESRKTLRGLMNGHTGAVKDDDMGDYIQQVQALSEISINLFEVVIPAFRESFEMLSEAEKYIAAVEAKMKEDGAVPADATTEAPVTENQTTDTTTEVSA